MASNNATSASSAMEGCGDGNSILQQLNNGNGAQLSELQRFIVNAANSALELTVRPIRNDTLLQSADELMRIANLDSSYSIHNTSVPESPSNAPSLPNAGVSNSNIQPPKPLAGVVACLSGQDGPSKLMLRSIVELMGGTTMPNLSGLLGITHLIIDEALGEKYNFWKAHKEANFSWALQIQAVTSQWLLECLRQKCRVSEAEYILPPCRGEDTSAKDGDDGQSIKSQPTLGDNISITRHSDTPSDFVTRWVSKGASLDRYAYEHPDQYPDGDVTITITGAKEKPKVEWASTLKGRYPNKVSHCLGTWVCSSFDDNCHKRERCQAPRYGKNKYNTEGQIPAPKTRCVMHNTDSVYLPCSCSWTVKQDSNEEDTWRIIHSGTHNHPAPPPKHARPDSEQFLAQVLTFHPDITTTQLAAGRGPRPPMGQIDPAYINEGYLQHRRTRARRVVSKHVTGREMGAECMDAAMAFNNYMKKKFSVYDSSKFHGKNVLGKDHGPCFVFQGPYMRDEFLRSPNAHESDTIESASDSVLFENKVQITMTSGWSQSLGRQCPFLVTVLPSKDTVSYGMHWKQLFEAYSDVMFDDPDEFFEYYQGNTCDMSDALREGWTQEMEWFVINEFGQEFPPEKIDSLYGFCLKHFGSSVNKASEISAFIPPECQQDFKRRAKALPDIESFSQFEEEVKSLASDYPNITPWLAWYLSDKRCSIIFKACKTASTNDLAKFDRLKKTTNGQEGLGNALKQLVVGKTLVSNELLEVVAEFCQKFEGYISTSRQGLPCKYTRHTKSEKNKKSGEPKHKYKDPDSFNMMQTYGKSLQAVTNPKKATAKGDEQFLRSPPKKDEFPIDLKPGIVELLVLQVD